MQVRCASCHKERSDKQMVKAFYRSGSNRLSDFYAELDNVYICASRQTCKQYRKAMREVDEALEQSPLRVRDQSGVS